MKDMLISLGLTAAWAPLVTAYVMGWAWTKDVLLALVASLAVVRASIESFFSTAHEDASDW